MNRQDAKDAKEARELPEVVQEPDPALDNLAHAVIGTAIEHGIERIVFSR